MPRPASEDAQRLGRRMTKVGRAKRPTGGCGGVAPRDNSGAGVARGDGREEEGDDGPLRGERSVCGRATSIGSHTILEYSTEGASHRESGTHSRSVPAPHVTVRPLEKA
jgi:hypothetical protein